MSHYGVVSVTVQKRSLSSQGVDYPCSFTKTTTKNAFFIRQAIKTERGHSTRMRSEFEKELNENNTQCVRIRDKNVNFVLCQFQSFVLYLQKECFDFLFWNWHRMKFMFLSLILTNCTLFSFSSFSSCHPPLKTEQLPSLLSTLTFACVTVRQQQSSSSSMISSTYVTESHGIHQHTSSAHMSLLIHV